MIMKRTWLSIITPSCEEWHLLLQLEKQVQPLKYFELQPPASYILGSGRLHIPH